VSTSPSERQPARKTIAGLAAHTATSLRECWRTIAASIDPDESEAWLVEAQLNLFRQTTRYSAFLMPIGAFLIALACEPWVSAAVRFGWCAAVLILCVALDVFGRRVDAIEGHSAAIVRHRARLYEIMTVVFLATWCSMGIFLWAPGIIINHMMLILILACSLAGSIAISAVHPASAATVFVIHAAFILGPATSAGSRLDHMLAGLAAVFIALVAGQLVAVNKSMTKMLTLEHDRAGLVADLQEAKRESDRERTRASAAGRAKSQFLSNMNHELRTPMNAILGFSDLIRSKSFGAAIDKYAEYAGIIYESGQHLLHLIDDMFDLAKIEGGRFHLRESDFSLAHLIDEEYEMNVSKAEAEKVSLAISLEQNLPQVRADERGLRQIVANLLSNALKYTPPGGCVTLFARMEPDGRIAFGVEDTGIGIAPEDQLLAFERFGNGRHDVTTADRGSGLGLAIVKGFADAHDAETELESELGAGTRVTVYLPRERMIALSAARATG
jgi:two-component system, cell cycle sensor histidine kinase PleC